VRWRRWHDDSDQQLDNAHLMRLAGRFARRVRAWAETHEVPVIDCKAGERKHLIAEEYLSEHTVGVGVFLIMVARPTNTGWVSVGTDHDASAFAVGTLSAWWDTGGRARYPGAQRLLICADGGGSNGSRVRAGKSSLPRSRPTPA
jgi:hypothetical protein